MPTVPRAKDFKKKYMKSKAVSLPQENDDTAEHRFFNSRRYREFRTVCISKQPVCEVSLVENKVVPANQLHHVLKWYQASNDDAVRWQLLLDPDNVISICGYIHQSIHYCPDRLTEAQKKYIQEKKDKVFAKYIKQGLMINYTSDRNTHFINDENDTKSDFPWF